jgi:metal-dependent amidase/aminoacylase/carboxypeptidase family protein
LPNGGGDFHDSRNGCTVDVDHTRVFVPLINDPVATEHAVAAARDVFGAATVNANAPRMGASEDFAQALWSGP